jgi:hypothetical protein
MKDFKKTSEMHSPNAILYCVIQERIQLLYTCIYTFKWVEIMNKCLYIDLKHASYLHF